MKRKQEPQPGLGFKERLQIRMKRTKTHSAPLALGLLALCLVGFVLAAVLPAGAEPASAAAPEAGQTRLTLLGDLTMGGNIRTYGRETGFDTLFENVQGLWADSDYVLASLNCVALAQKESAYADAPERSYPQPTDMAALQAMAASGINVAALATHHTMDYGPQAMLQELSLLDSLGVQYAGAGQTVQDAAQYVLLPLGSRTVAFLSCSYVIDEDAAANQEAGILTPNYAQLYETVNLAAEQADFVVVYVSWGKADAIAVTQAQQDAAHQLSAAGADLIIGNYPGVLQPVEQYHDSTIFYSLGNLISDQGQSREKDGAIVQLTLNEDGSGQLELIPTRTVEGTPQVCRNSFYVNRSMQVLTGQLDASGYEITDGRLYLPFTLRTDAAELPPAA